MFVSASTIDDLLLSVFKKTLSSKTFTVNQRGNTTEVTGALLKLTRPRFRLSQTETKRTLFSGFGELLWYLAGTTNLKFISYYVPQYPKFSDGRGGYGPRLFKMRGAINQVDNIIRLLKTEDRLESRQAVIQLFDAYDLVQKKTKDIPCTCTLQFLVRRHRQHHRLHMFVSMRSNDAYKGLPHDLFSFTMLQEIVARSLGVELGTYNHAVGSLHIYDDDRPDVEQYLREGYQSTKSETSAMPPMPMGDPWSSISRLRNIEIKIRNGKSVDLNNLQLDPYWLDIVRLLLIHSVLRKKKLSKSDKTKLRNLKRAMHSQYYITHVLKRQRKKSAGALPRQLTLEKIIKV